MDDRRSDSARIEDKCSDAKPSRAGTAACWWQECVCGPGRLRGRAPVLDASLAGAGIFSEVYEMERMAEASLFGWYVPNGEPRRIADPRLALASTGP